MNRIFKFIESIIDSLMDLSDREPSGRTFLIVSILGACIAEYIYYSSSTEGYFLTAIFVALAGGVLGIIVFSFLRMIPALLGMTIVSGIVMGSIFAIIKLFDFLSGVQLWSK